MEMNSFYMQHSETLFSVNHLLNQSLFPQEQQYNFGFYRPVETGIPNQVWAPTRKLPDFNPHQPMPSVHRVSRPPKAMFQPVTPAFPETTKPQRKERETVSPPCFKIQLSDPAFLLESEASFAEVEIVAPPTMDRILSDPCFLLEHDPSTINDPLLETEVLDEWDENELVAEDRSKSSESGSSYRSYASKPLEPTFEQKTKQIENIIPRNKKVTKTVPDWALDTRVHVVERRRKKRKIIESGEVYRTKRHVKVTKEENPSFYKKPKRSRNKTNKRRERDPNEIWTLNPGVAVEVLEIHDKRAYIFCTVEFWSKHQDRDYDRPRQKRVEGWITLKDQKGWVL